MTFTDTYLAGFFDGEGCIGIYRNGQRAFHLRVQLVQNESQIVTAMFQELQERFGGSFRGHPSSSGRSKYNFQLNADKAVAFLTTIQPHLLLKRLEADVAILWHTSRPRRERCAKGRIQGHPPEQQAFDAKIAELVKVLKRRDAAEVLEERPDLKAAALQLGISLTKLS